MKDFFSLILLMLLVLPIEAKTYYVNSNIGKDSNGGTSMKAPFQTLDKVNSLKLKAGDQVLLASGCTFTGSLILKNQSGSKGKPITISNYISSKSADNKNTIIDASGFPNGILIENSSYITVKNISITANNDKIENTNSKNDKMRCGVLVKSTKSGVYSNVFLDHLHVYDIFIEKKGYERGSEEVVSANGTQRYGWGIRFITEKQNSILENVKVESCLVENVSHTGIKFTSEKSGQNIKNISVLNNQVRKTGGPGIQMSGVFKGIVSGNTVDRSGSDDDSRKWGRGSGLWTWGTSDVVIEHNSFRNANGPGDSAGCHIDFNCRNVIVQYNFSENNAGGFCEILGNNHNCAYRYNISVNDGYREKGVHGAFQEGKIFWLSGFNGNKKRSGPFDSYFYNNTIYVSKDIVAKIAVDHVSNGILIANNIFYIEGESMLVFGDQYKPDTGGASEIENVVFENNLYLKKSNWPSDVLIQDTHPLFGNPMFVKPGGDEIKDYKPTNEELVKNKGIKIKPIPGDIIGLKIGLEVKYDFMGNAIQGTPDLGAIELN